MSQKKFCYFSVFQRTDQKIAFRQARSIKDAGHDVTLLFCDGLPEEEIDGMKVKTIPLKANIGQYFKRLFLFPFYFAKELKAIDADIYECCDIDSLLLCLILKRRGKRVIFNLLEEHPYTLKDKIRGPKWLKNAIIIIMAQWMRFTLRRVDMVFTVAPSIVDYLHKWGLKNVQILGNYPNINKDYCLTYEDYGQRQNRILYFGAIYSISRQEVFFDALSSLNNVTYLLAGDFGIGYYKDILRMHPYWNKVEFINRFPPSDLPKLMAKSTISNVLRDFGVTGYKTGSYGVIKVFESMEAGLPIICSDVQVYRDIMREYPCGILVNPNDSLEIRNAIQYLVNNKKEAYEMGQNGRRAIIEKYNWETESKKLLALFND